MKKEGGYREVLCEERKKIQRDSLRRKEEVTKSVKKGG